MDNKEVKLNVMAKDGAVTVLTGKNFYTLEDCTSATFKTDSIESFVKYVKSAVNNNEAKVFYTRTSARCVSKEIEFTTKDIATLSMRLSEPLNKLNKALLVSGLTPAGMDEFLTFMRPYFSNNTNDFRSKVRSTIVTAVTEAERTIDNCGNYKFAVTRKGLGRQELGLPDEIGFIVPVFELLNDTIDIRVEPSFTFVETGDAKEPIKMSWTLRCPNIDEIIKEATVSIMQEKFSELNPGTCLYGELDISRETDNWKYKESEGNLV